MHDHVIPHFRNIITPVVILITCPRHLVYIGRPLASSKKNIKEERIKQEKRTNVKLTQIQNTLKSSIMLRIVNKTPTAINGGYKAR